MLLLLRADVWRNWRCLISPVNHSRSSRRKHMIDTQMICVWKFDFGQKLFGRQSEKTLRVIPPFWSVWRRYFNFQQVRLSYSKSIRKIQAFCLMTILHLNRSVIVQINVKITFQFKIESYERSSFENSESYIFNLALNTPIESHEPFFQNEFMPGALHLSIHETGSTRGAIYCSFIGYVWGLFCIKLAIKANVVISLFMLHWPVTFA
jgi:hypothetical protein